VSVCHLSLTFLSLMQSTFDDGFEKPKKQVYDGYGSFAVWMIPSKGHRRSLQSHIELENAYLLTTMTQQNVHLTSIFAVRAEDMEIYGRVQNCILTVMEWVDDKDLFQVYIEDTIVWTDCKLLLKLYDHMKIAITFMHKNGASHLDVKLENIIYTDNGVFKLCDFGSMTTKQNISVDQANICGTAHYRAPELFYSGAEIQIQSTSLDLWSLGMVLIVLKRSAFFNESFINRQYDIYKSTNKRYDDFFTAAIEHHARLKMSVWQHNVIETRQYRVFSNILSHLLAFEPSMRQWV